MEKQQNIVEIIHHLKSIGFKQRTKSTLTRGADLVKFIDETKIEISFFNPETGIDFSVLADLKDSDLSKVSMI